MNTSLRTRFNLLPNKYLVITACIIGIMLNTVLAKTEISVGPEIGKKAPELTVANTLNEPVNIAQLSKEKGLVILFFRSADWCGFCKKHLVELNEQADKFSHLGYGLAGISYDDSKTLQKFIEEKNISYPLLSDQNVATISAYNIINKDYELGDDNYGIPYPGVVVVDEKGIVITKSFFKGYKDRVNFSELYTALQKMK